MNQILATSNDPEPQKKRVNNNIYTNKGGKREIKSVTKIFAIILFLVAVSIVGIGIYIYMDTQKSETTESQKIPTVKQEILEGNKLKITVLHDKELKKASYMWGELEIPVECEGKKEIELTVDMPLGENLFTFSVEDINGEKALLEKQFVVNYGIAVSINGNKTKIEAKGENNFEYMTYRWNEEEETKIEISSKEFSKEIDTPKGENTLTLAFVDEEKETLEKTQKIKGIVEPSISMSYEGKDILIKAEDEDKLTNFKLIKNGQEISNKKLEEALFEYTLKSNEFKHTDKIEVIVSNVEGIEVSLTRPVINVKYDETGDNIEIKGNDDIELKELKVTINDKEPKSGTTNEKTLEYLYPVEELKPGDSMKIEVINSKNVLNQVTIKLK